jgi:hypothetical protein
MNRYSCTPALPSFTMLSGPDLMSKDSVNNPGISQTPPTTTAATGESSFTAADYLNILLQHGEPANLRVALRQMEVTRRHSRAG